MLYKTTNLLNGRFYIGMHSTENPDDGYLGSGRRIKAEIKKYGRENFKREILEVLTSRDALKAREAEFVNEALRSDPLCLNLKNGGEGGGRIWNAEHLKKFKAGNAKGGKITGAINGASKFKQLNKSGRLNPARFRNKNHTDDTKRKMSLSHRGKHNGENNSQFGTCWVTNGAKPIKIKKELLVEYIANGYVRGRSYPGALRG